VFFETDELLKQYQTSQVSVLRSRNCSLEDIRVLNSKVEGKQRDELIPRACKPRAITLCSREFGRGEDFKVYNTNLIQAGGLHVISTFLPLDISEQVQIQGRTGRQTNPGSFSLVLSTQDIWKSAG
jgi:preprotein translocase subunit SecA